jgi:opacity protein-like surface antigen
MANWRGLALVAGLSIASGGLARAVDLPPAPRLPSPAPAGAEFSGWYLRGDVGAGINASEPDLQNLSDPIAAGVSRGFLSTSASQAFNNTTLSPYEMIDLGVGYQFDNWFRTDVTLEYRAGATLQSLYTLADPASPSFGGPLQTADFYRANVSSFIGLVNGYVNLPVFWGVSPFVGAGVGFANNTVSGFTDQGVGIASFGSLGPSGGYFSNSSKTSFAWALMAGLDFAISRDLKVELGYRYLDYGSIGTGSSHCLAGTLGGVFNTASCSGRVANAISSRNRLASNDIRLGLIWTPGELVVPSAPIAARD